MHSQSAFEAVTRRARAVADRGTGVAAHYGSPAGELAVCARAVGLADRSDLIKLELRGHEPVVERLVQAVVGFSLAPGGCATTGGTWMCARSEASVVALVEPGRDCFLTDWADRSGPGFRVEDRTERWAAIALVGPATNKLLAALDLLSDPRLAPPFSEVRVDGAEADLLLQSSSRALLLTEARNACRVWSAVESAGKPLGLGYVGSEALRRFSVRERMRL